MDNYRFDYLDDKSLEELEKEMEDTKQDLEQCQKQINEGKNSESTAELYNDLKYDREKLEYLEELITSKNSKHI